MTSSPEPRFSASDLQPSPYERKLAFRARLEVVAAGVTALVVGLWLGGRVVLGACAAPAIFGKVPPPLSGYAMGEAFARLDRLALGGAAIVLAMELLRTVLSLRHRRTLGLRLRRLCAFALGAVAVYFALVLTPQIRSLYQQGARRGEGEAGARLEAVHRQAMRYGQLELLLGAVLIGLHLGTLRPTSPWHQDDEDVADEPLPPGPSEA